MKQIRKTPKEEMVVENDALEKGLQKYAKIAEKQAAALGSLILLGRGSHTTMDSFPQRSLSPITPTRSTIKKNLKRKKRLKRR